MFKENYTDEKGNNSTLYFKDSSKSRQNYQMLTGIPFGLELINNQFVIPLLKQDLDLLTDLDKAKIKMNSEVYNFVKNALVAMYCKEDGTQTDNLIAEASNFNLIDNSSINFYIVLRDIINESIK